MNTDPKKDPELSGFATEEYGDLIEPATLRIVRVLPGPIELVWAFLTESEKRGQWLASGEMEMKEGGLITLIFQHANLSSEKDFPDQYKEYQCGHTMTGLVTRCEPPHVLSYIWGEDSGKDSEVTFELTPKGDDVLLVLTHRRLVERKDLLSTAAGWHAHIGILLDVLHKREPRGFWSTHSRLEKEYTKRIVGK